MPIVYIEVERLTRLEIAELQNKVWRKQLASSEAS